MNARTYQAGSMSEALAEVKRDLGRDAVILHTRRRRKGALLGVLGGRHIWEVTAAASVNVLPRGSAGTYESDSPEQPEGQPAPKRRAASVPTDDAAGEQGENGDGRLDEIHSMVRALLDRRAGEQADEMPPELRWYYERLLEEDVAENVAADLVSQLRSSLTGQELTDADGVRDRLWDMIAARIPTRSSEPPARDDGRARVVALIGPTGVGKTTTVAKLAADYKLRRGCSVGLITMDTYRIAAVEQLRTYAEIIEVPLRTVLSPGEVYQAVHAMSGMDVVLLDTAGRSQNNRMRLNQLKGFLDAAEPDETHLVVSATSNRKTAGMVLERFVPLGADHLLVTKLDEAATFGMILNLTATAETPLSFVTTGQDVPDDIAPADAHRLAEAIVAGPKLQEA
ncbi:MAG: flagellar biosynthesis protein FlhF [Phycisphaerae bacterium]